MAVVIILLALQSCQQKMDHYQISGTISNIPDNLKIDLYQMFDDYGETIKSDTILDGQFGFSGTLEKRPSKMLLVVHDSNTYYGNFYFWVDYDNITITGNGMSPASWRINSKVEEQKNWDLLHSKSKYIQIISDSLRLTMMKNPENRNLRQEIYRKIDSLNSIKNKLDFTILEKNYNSLSAVEMLYTIAKFDTTIPKESIRKVYGNMNDTFKHTNYGEGIAATLEKRKAPQKGDMMADFTAHDTAGIEHRISDYRGKYILLDFWSNGCGPCIMAIPETRAVASKNKDVLTAIGISLITNEKAWKDATRRDTITWTNLSDGKGTFAGASSLYGIEGFPTYVLINPDGIIVDRWLGYWKGVFQEKLSKHIKEFRN